MMKLIGLCLVSLALLAAHALAELDYSLDDPQFLNELNEGKLDDQLLNNLTLNPASAIFVSELTNGDEILSSNRLNRLHVIHEDCPPGFAQRLLESINNVRARHGAQPLVLDDQYADNYEANRGGVQVQYQTPFTEIKYNEDGLAENFRLLISPDQVVQDWYLDGLRRYRSYGQEPDDEVKAVNNYFARLIWASANLGAVVCEVQHEAGGLSVKNSIQIRLATNANLNDNFTTNVLPPNYLKWESDIEVVIETDDKTNV